MNTSIPFCNCTWQLLLDNYLKENIINLKQMNALKNSIRILSKKGINVVLFQDENAIQLIEPILDDLKKYCNKYITGRWEFVYSKLSFDLIMHIRNLFHYNFLWRGNDKFSSYVNSDPNKQLIQNIINLIENNEYQILLYTGKKGMGKTHILRCTEDYIDNFHKNLRIVKFPSENLIQLLGMIKGNIYDLENFVSWFEYVDIVLIDDLDFLLNSSLWGLFIEWCNKIQNVKIIMCGDDQDYSMLFQIIKPVIKCDELKLPNFDTRVNIIHDILLNRGEPSIIEQEVCKLIALEPIVNITELNKIINYIIFLGVSKYKINSIDKKTVKKLIKRYRRTLIC